MKKQYKYALAGLSFAASTATSIYFGVKGFSTKPPFENTAYQKEYPGHEFILGGYGDSEWVGKSDSFLKELKYKSQIEAAFKDAGGLGGYSHLMDDYDGKTDDEKKERVKKFLHDWCYKNRVFSSTSIFNLIGTWCIKKSK